MPSQETTGFAGFKNVVVAEFAKLVADKENLILDVRTPQEFAAGHLPCALNLDVNAADFGERVTALGKSKTYLGQRSFGGGSVTVDEQREGTPLLCWICCR